MIVGAAVLGLVGAAITMTFPSRSGRRAAPPKVEQPEAPPVSEPLAPPKAEDPAEDPAEDVPPEAVELSVPAPPPQPSPRPAVAEPAPPIEVEAVEPAVVPVPATPVTFVFDSALVVGVSDVPGTIASRRAVLVPQGVVRVQVERGDERDECTFPVGSSAESWSVTMVDGAARCLRLQ